jgi:hypothetical protein
MMQIIQGAAEVEVVIDFPIECNREITALICHGLRASRDIQNSQTYMPQNGITNMCQPASVWSSMLDTIHHGMHQGFICSAKIGDYTAHNPATPFVVILVVSWVNITNFDLACSPLFRFILRVLIQYYPQKRMCQVWLYLNALLIAFSQSCQQLVTHIRLQKRRFQCISVAVEKVVDFPSKRIMQLV